MGNDRPSTIVSMNNLAVCLERQGKHNDAEHFYRDCVALAEKVLGLDNPTTKALRYNYQGVLDQMKSTPQTK